MKLDPSSHDLKESALAALDAEFAVDSESDLLEEGWVAAITMATRHNVSRDAADKRLRRRVADGAMEVQSFYLLKNGTRREVAFFRLK